jgi:hypothetical protein
VEEPMSADGYPFKSFPKDDVRRVVWLIGQPDKHGLYSSTAPLIDVLIVNLDEKNNLIGRGIVIKIVASELDTVRVGTIWCRQRRTNEMYYFNKQSKNRFEFNIPEDFKSDIKTIGRMHKINQTDKYSAIPVYIYPILDYLPINPEQRKSLINSRLTVLKSTSGAEVLIPAFELFTSTYAFDHKQIRNDLISLTIEDVVNKYVSFKHIEDDAYYLELIEPRSKANTTFLAYLAMNKKARAKISLLYSAIQTSKPYVDVYPYHKKMMIDCDGVWLDHKHQRFIVLRINGCSLPNEHKIRLIESVSDVDNIEDEHTPEHSNFYRPPPRIPKDLPVTSEHDPRKDIGSAHYLSDVKIIGGENDVEIITKKQYKESQVNESISLVAEQIEALSSGEPHYGQESEGIAQLKSSEIDKSDKIRIDPNVFLKKIIDALGSHHFDKEFIKVEYIDENLSISESYQLGSIDEREFLLVKITDKEKGSVFVLEFSRGHKLNDCRGLLFNISKAELSRDSLTILLKKISGNDFKYKNKDPSTRKMIKLSLPVNKMLIFNHQIADEAFFEKKYIETLSSFRAKKVFTRNFCGEGNGGYAVGT